jgi:hypothetical protein
MRAPQVPNSTSFFPLRAFKTSHPAACDDWKVARRCVFRFYAELNDFLAPDRRYRSSVRDFIDGATVKDMIESMGVPHTEVDLILVNGEPAAFGHIVRDGDSISVYPVFEAFDISQVSKVRPKPLRVTKFVLDTHLGRLAAYLRMAGFDTLYRNDFTDAELAAVSRGEHRVLLTRDAGLLKRGAVTHGHFIRQSDPKRQFAEVAARFDLARSMRPFTICMRCNEPLRETSPEEAAERVPARVAERFRVFRSCAACGRVYWRGGHYESMSRMLP